LADDEQCGEGDVVRLGPVIHGTRMGLRHRADHKREPVAVLPLKEGVPLSRGELVAFRRPGTDLFEVEEISLTQTKGPAKANSAAFRQGWGRIFGGKATVGEA